MSLAWNGGDVAGNRPGNAKGVSIGSGRSLAAMPVATPTWDAAQGVRAPASGRATLAGTRTEAAPPAPAPPIPVVPPAIPNRVNHVIYSPFREEVDLPTHWRSISIPGLKPGEIFRQVDPTDPTSVWVGPTSNPAIGRKVKLTNLISSELFRQGDPADPTRIHVGAKALLAGWDGKRKFDVVYHGQSAMPLRSIPIDAVLYVASHGEPGDQRVGDNLGNTLTAVALAKRLEGDGLKYLHRVIKLYVCNGANQGATGGPSLASGVLAALRALNYHAVTLYAYDKFMHIPKEGYDSADPTKLDPTLTKLGSVKDASGNRTFSRAKDAKVPIVG